MSTLTVLDWDRLLATPDTRWYLDPDDWEWACQCSWQIDCPDAVFACAEYQVCELPGDTSSTDFLDRYVIVCPKHLPELIAHATGEPLVPETVVEVGVDPALLRLTGVDPAFVDAKFNKHALGVSA